MEWVKRKISLFWSRDLPDEAYIKYQFDNLRLVGLYPGFSKAPYRKRLGLYAIELLCVLQNVAICYDLLDSRGDIERFGEDLCVLTAFTVVLAKRWFCRLHFDDLLVFVEQYRVGFKLYQHREQQFVQQLFLHHRLESLTVNTVRILGTVLGAGLIFHGLLSDGFILRAKYPFNTDTFIGYATVFFSQMVLNCYSVLSIVLVELCSILVISQLSLHFQLLSMDFATIGKEQSVHESLRQDEAVDARIKQLILRHQYVLELANQVTEVFNSNLMGLFVASVILICMSAFEILLAKGNLMLTFRFGMFVLCTFVQIFVWSFFGNLVAQKSSSICDAIASCNWTVFDRRQQKDLCFIMMRAQKPFIIKVYRMFPLTFETFLAILCRSYSAFTVLVEMIE